MSTLNDSVFAFYNDLRGQGLLSNTLVLLYSEFGRRISENGSAGTDHGAAGVMMAMGGAVRGGIYGTAASLDPAGQNPTLENAGGDVTYQTDFRSVYARVLDNWLARPRCRSWAATSAQAPRRLSEPFWPGRDAGGVRACRARFTDRPHKRQAVTAVLDLRAIMSA